MREWEWDGRASEDVSIEGGAMVGEVCWNGRCGVGWAVEKGDL